MKPKKTSLLSKISLSLLMVVTVGLVLVGCTYKSNKTQEDLKTLEPISFAMLTKYSVKSNSAAATELYENGEIKNAYSGALISSKISAFHDKAKEYPTVQIWIDGKTENYYIEKVSENAQITINNQGYRAYYLDAKGNKQTGRATLVVDKDGAGEPVVRLVVHPNLTGSTSFYRTVRGKAIPAHDSTWKASAYSSALNIQVRKLTFVAHSYNSSDYNFANLSYSADLYPFSTATPTGATAFKFLEGYFVDGRVVCVTRTQTDEANYEVQCWTVDAPANNFVSLSSSDTKLAGNTTTDNLALKGGTNILSATSTDTISAWDESIKEEGRAFVYSDSEDTLQNSIFVRASSSTHKKTFYANYAKTNNFSISGRVFNADAISTINPKLIGLKDVVITVHGNNNLQQITTEQYNALSESDKAKFEPIGDDKYLRIETCLTDANGGFEITNLSKDAYLTFYYLGNGTEDTGDNTELDTKGVEYRFVSSFFTEKDIDAKTIKAITLLSKDVSKSGPTDTENVSVNASALPGDSNLEVIINFINDADASKNTTARYEYVTGITGETHYYKADGKICNESHNHDESTTCTAYTTTTVLVSVVPGKNNLVKSYTIETKVDEILTKYTLAQDDENGQLVIDSTKYKTTLTQEAITDYTVAADLSKITIGTTTYTKIVPKIVMPYDIWWDITAKDVLYTDSTATSITKYDLSTTENQNAELVLTISGTQYWATNPEIIQKYSTNPETGAIITNYEISQDQQTLTIGGEANYTKTTGSTTQDGNTAWINGSEMLVFSTNTSLLGSNSSVRAEVYESEMKNDNGTPNDTTDDQPIYLYYSLAEGNYNVTDNNGTTTKALFLTDPVAYADSNAEGGINFFPAGTDGTALITNGEQLITAGKIMSGKDIIAIKNGDTQVTEELKAQVTAFYNLIPAAIRENYYYYVAPICQTSAKQTVFLRVENETSQINLINDFVFFTSDNLKQYAITITNETTGQQASGFTQNISEFINPKAQSESDPGDQDIKFAISDNYEITAPDFKKADNNSYYYTEAIASITKNNQSTYDALIVTKDDKTFIDTNEDGSYNDGTDILLTFNDVDDIYEYVENQETKYYLRATTIDEVNYYYDDRNNNSHYETDERLLLKADAVVYEYYIQQASTYYHLASASIKAYDSSDAETTNIQDLAYFKLNDTVVAATGKCIKDNYSESTFKSFLNACGFAQDTYPTKLIDNAIYFVSPFSQTNEKPENVTNATKQIQYAYAFLKDNSTDQTTLKDDTTDQSTLSRSQIAANNKAIFVLGKTMASSTGFYQINALTPLGASKPTYTTTENIANALAESGYSVKISESSINTVTKGKPYSIHIDQTISGSEVQGALGMSYLSGTPYPNPVFRFVVRHKRDAAQITLNVNLDQIYYVEALGTLAERETSDVIVDFSTFTFRSEEQNILNNSTRYNPKQTTILTKSGLKELSLPQLNKIANSDNYALSFLRLAVEDFATYYNDSNIYYTGSNDKVLAYCAGIISEEEFNTLEESEQQNYTKTNINGTTCYVEYIKNKGHVLCTEFSATSENQETYSLVFDTASGQWILRDGNGTATILVATNAITESYAQTIYSAIKNKTAQTAADATNFVVWSSSSEALNDIAFFDIHTYNANELQDNGNLELASECEDPCIGLLNLDESDILDPSNNYDNVAIAGTTSMYRILKSKATSSAGSPQGYYEGIALFLEAAENAADPFFYISTDAVVAIASPTVVISPDENDFTSNIYYRFKEWRVYKRFNSQIIQRCESNQYSISQNGTILYFAPEQSEDVSATGYYLLLPVYERLYSVSVATYSTDGTPNVGGSIGIESKSFFYIYNENQNYMILPLTKDYTIETNTELNFVEIGEAKTIYYVITDSYGTKTLVNTNGNFFATLELQPREESAEDLTVYYTATKADGTTIENLTIITASMLTDPNFGATFKNTSGFDISISSKGQYMALRHIGYTVTDKYGKQTTISAFVGKSGTIPEDGNYIDAEGYIYVSGMRIAQAISKEAYSFTGYRNAAYKISSMDSTIFDRLSPDTWLLDRHSLVNLVASGANGYRFAGWYLVDKDTDTNTMIKSTLEAFTENPTDYDVLSLPSNIYLLENGNYYKYELNYQNFAGKYEIKKVPTNIENIPSNAFILYNGRLYNSTSIVSSNIVGSLMDYSESGVNYDNFIEYFYYQTEVIVPTNTTAYAVGSFIYENEQTTDLQTAEHGLVVGNCYNTITVGAQSVQNGKYKVTSVNGTQVSYTEKSTKLVTRILPYKYNSFGTVSKYAVHFVDTANLIEPLFNFVYVGDDDGQVTGPATGPNGMLSAYRGTEIFYDVSPHQNDFFFLGQSTQNAATLVPTRVLTVKQNLVLEQTRLTPAEYTIFIDGIPYVIGSDVRVSTDAAGSDQISAPSSLDEVKYIIFAYGHSNQESYEVYKNEDDNTYHIIRYYLFVQNNNYQLEVFDYNEDAQTYVTHDHTIAVNERTGNVEDGSNWQTLNALQQPKVDFVLNQISAVSISTGETMPTHYQTSEVSEDVYTLEINDHTLKIKKDGDRYTVVAYKTSDSTNKKEFSHTNGTITAVVVNNKTIIRITRIDEIANVLHVYCKADSYELSSTVLYETDGFFYRSRTEGNIVVNDSSVRINALGKNLLLVAVFQQYYHMYAQTDVDASSEESIEITGMFYFNKQDNSKAVRTKSGEVVKDYDESTISLNTNKANYTSEGGLFAYKAEVGGGYETLSLTIKTSFQTEDFVVNDSTYYATVDTTKQTLIKNHGNLDVTNLLSLHKKSGEDQTITIDYAKIEKYQLVVKLSYIPSGSSESVSKTLTVSTDYTYDSYYDTDFLGALANGGYSIADTGKNPGHAVPISLVQNKWLDFDAGTSLIIVVRCGKGANLTTASLGLKNIGNLEFLLSPTNSALANKNIKYYFYVLKIDLEPTYQNTYLESLTHPYNKSLLLRDLSVRSVYKDASGKFYFVKESNQKREDYTNNVIYVDQENKYSYSLPLTTTSTEKNGAQTEFVAQVSVGSVIRYYYVPSGNLADLSGIEGAVDKNGQLLSTTKWVDNSSQNAKTPLKITYYKHDSKAENRTEITTNAVNLKQLINGDIVDESTLSITNGYTSNYLNLTSIEIYQFDIFALSLPFGQTIENYDFTKQDGSQPINFDGNTTLLASGGRQINGEQVRIISLEKQGTKPEPIASKIFDEYTISTDDYVSNNIMQPLSLVVDTLLTLSRPTGESATYPVSDDNNQQPQYIFAGWYQIKQTGTNEQGNPVWGTPTYLGGEVFVSPVVADANTIVIALYKEVKYTSITFDTTKVMFESSTPIDMLGNSIVTQAPTVENDYKITLGGYFTSDFSWGIRLTPVAGNRLKSTTAIPFEGDLTGTKTILFGASEQTDPYYGASYGADYTVETIQTTTVLVRIENFDEIAKSEHTVTITAKNDTSTIYFSTNFLNIINNVIDVVTINRTQYQILADNSDINNPIYYADIDGNKIYDSEIDQIVLKDTDHNFYYIDTNEDNEYNAVENKSIKIHKYTYALGTGYTATKDSTGNYFSAMIVKGTTTPITATAFTTSSRELLVIITLDRGTEIQLNHSAIANAQTNFVGWKKNGNSQQNSSELYQDELTDGAVEYSAIIEQIQSLTFAFEIEGIEDPDNAFASAIKEELKNKLNLVYTAERYTLDGGIYTIVSTDTNKTLTYTGDGSTTPSDLLFSTYYFSHNSNLSFSIPTLNSIIAISGHHFVLVGYHNDTDSTLTHSAGYSHNITKPTTITLIFAPSSELTNDKETKNGTSFDFQATDSEFIENARLIHGQKITLTASSLSPTTAVIECYKIKIGTEPEFVVTTSGETKIDGIGKVTYTISESSITLSYSGAETSIKITAVANTGVIIN